MIELETLNNKDINKEQNNNNNNDLTLNTELLQKEEEKNRTSSSYKNIKNDTIKTKTTTNNKKNKKYINDEIDFDLPVEDIVKKLTRQGKISNKKVFFVFLYVFLALQLTNSTFIIYLGYLRPPLLTNDYYCYDLQSKNYYKCLSENFCRCDGKYCVLFCYEKNTSKCYDEFYQQYQELEDKNLRLDLPENYRKIEQTHIIYSMEDNENISIFQRVSLFYCFINYFIFGFLSFFVFGGWIGYYLFGLLAGLHGKKTAIIILSICNLIIIVVFDILANFSFNYYYPLMIILWSFVHFLFGIFLLPLESAIYVYLLEYIPKTEFIKPINSLSFEKYFFSIFIYYIVNTYVKNYVYYLIFYAAFLFIFIFIMIFFYHDTPRYYSEHQNVNLKKKSLSLYLNENLLSNNQSNQKNDNASKLKKASTINRYKSSFNNYENNNSNNNFQRNINSKYLKKAIQKNTRISKKFFMILLSYFTISYCFHTLLIQVIFNTCNPHMTISGSFKITAFIVLVFLFALLSVISYFVFEIVDLDKYIFFLYSIFSILCLFYDFSELKDDSYRINMFNSKLNKKNDKLLLSCLFFILFPYSIYEMMLLLLSPTLYRTFFYFKVKGLANYSILLAYMSVVCFECPIFVVGIVSIFTTCLFYVMKIRWKFDSFEEDIDIEINRRESKKED